MYCKCFLHIDYHFFWCFSVSKISNSKSIENSIYMIAPAQQSNLQNQLNNDFQQLLQDLKTTEKLLSLENYRTVTLEQLNNYLRNNPIENNHFGLLSHFYIDYEINRLVPARMVVYGKEIVAF